MRETTAALGRPGAPVVGRCDQPFVLYRALDHEGRLLYVGQTADLQARLGDHRVTAWWSDVAEVATEGFDDRAAAMAAELVAIETEHPRENARIGYGPVTLRAVDPGEYAEVLDLLLPEDERTGGPGDLAEALRRAPGRLDDLARQVGLLVADLYASGRSWRAIEAETGVPHGTARRWAGVAR